MEGVTLVATTRFPQDCAIRYAKENDFMEWGSRLHIVGLDLRDIRRLEAFIEFMVILILTIPTSESSDIDKTNIETPTVTAGPKI